MARLSGNDIGGSPPFINLTAVPTDEEEVALITIDYQPSAFGDIIKSDFRCECQSSYDGLLNLAGSVYGAAYLQTIQTNISNSSPIPNTVALWKRTDPLIFVVENGPDPSLVDILNVIVFVQPDVHERLVSRFFMTVSCGDLRTFGRQLFNELASLPGFDTDNIQYIREDWRM